MRRPCGEPDPVVGERPGDLREPAIQRVIVTVEEHEYTTAGLLRTTVPCTSRSEAITLDEMDPLEATCARGGVVIGSVVDDDDFE